MRKTTTSVLVLIALLALCGSAFSVLARGNATKAVRDDLSTHMGYTPHRVRFFSQNSGGGGLTPAQFRRAYGVSLLSNTGSGITVAIVDAYGNPNAQKDLNTYDSTYGLSAGTVTTVYPQGKPGTVNQGWALETDLDVQMVHATAPGAKIVLEAAKSASLANLLGAVRDAYSNRGATIVSMSFGGAEFAAETSAAADGVFAVGTAKGVSFTASSGDNGTGAQYPAASPYVTSVGGTTLTQHNGMYVGEKAWSGSGGGVSAFEKRPTYQVGFNKNGKRGIPDVAMVADPATGVSIYDSFGYQGQKGFFIVGGTSVAAPMFAGVLALANQSRTTTFKNADVELYAVAKAHYASDFHDITTGTNGTCGAICTAHTGYDYITGLGSPVANKLVPALAAAA